MHTLIFAAWLLSQRPGTCPSPHESFGNWAVQLDPSLFQRSSCHGSVMLLRRYQENVLFIARQYKQFSLMSQSNSIVLKAIDNSDSRIRFAALLVTADQDRDGMADIYLAKLTDDDALVRQAARRALNIVSANHLSPGWRKHKSDLKKLRKVDYIDFGPTPCSNGKEIQGSVELWKEWLKDQGLSDGEKISPDRKRKTSQ